MEKHLFILVPLSIVKVYMIVLNEWIDVSKLLITRDADLSIRDHQGNLALRWMESYKG